MKEIIINADDFGLAHSINDAIVRMYKAKMITQTSIMAVGNAVDEAIEFALKYKIPCGVHLVLACECDSKPFKPLTKCRTITDENGYFHPHIKGYFDNVDIYEVESELIKQIERIQQAGIQITHLDSHICTYSIDLLRKLSITYDLHVRDEIEVGDREKSIFDSLYHLTIAGKSLDEKIANFVKYINKLDEGKHIIVCHPTIKDGDFEKMISDKSFMRKKWIKEYRNSDIDCLLSEKVRNVLHSRKDLNIFLTTC